MFSTSRFSARAFLYPRHWPDPFLRFGAAEIFFLAMDVWCHITAQQREETCDRKSFVEVTHSLEVDGRGGSNSMRGKIPLHHEEYVNDAKVTLVSCASQ
jgi:hypothetical protein